MSVHYKFKSALNSDTVTFDGLHISVGDLKKAIIHQKRLGKTVDFDLQITNAQTKEEYSDNNTLIPKNTSLIVARIPLAVQPKKQWDIQAEKQQQQSHRHINAPEPDSGALDLSLMNGTEEDKIQAMMIQSTMDYDPNKFKHSYQVIRGQSQVGEVPANYRCFKCRKPGHWIKNCPLSSNGDANDFKRNTGIPRSFIERDAQDKNSAANAEPTPPPVVEKKQEIPEDLICGICKDLFTDAVMIPCCGSSFCDECVRTALLESEDNECPDCKEKGSSPGSLIPNRFLRNSVNAFKNETGYSKPRQQKPPPKPKEPQEVAAATEESGDKKEEPDTTSEQKSEPKPSEKENDDKSSPLHSSSAARESPVKEKKEVEGHDKKIDPGHHSSHDEIESDFEDNITVTVPPAHLISHQRSEYRERPYNGRHSRHLRPPGMDGSPKHNSQSTPSHGERSGTPTVDEKESGHHEHHDHHKHHQQIPSHQAGPHRGDPIRPHRSTPSDMYGPGAPITSYPPAQGPMMGPGRPYEMGGYGPPPGPGYPPYMMDNRMRGPFHPIRPGYPQPHQMRPRMMAPPGSLASVYHGVAAKVGPGIIDDPLEAFNRIMREKEKRKEERRRLPTDSRRRSRSIELGPSRGGRGHSPPSHHGRLQRVRSPDDRRMRSPQMRDRRGRSRDKRSPEKEKRRHRSSSFSDRSRSRTRSRSWSNPRKRSKSPVLRRRSRSRSPSFTMSRSRSRSLTPHRRLNLAVRRYNRSPEPHGRRALSPRYRQKENRRPERRDDFPPREEFRDRSPGNYPPRRGRSPRRGQSPPPQHNQFYGRQERAGHGGPPPDQYFNMPSGPPGPYNENAPYAQSNSGNNRYPERIPPHREQYNRDRNHDYKMERFEDGPPGNDEPPPPGFEASPPSPRERHNSWNNNNPFDDRERGGNYRHELRKESNIRNRGHTPNEARDKHSTERDREERRHHEGRDRETRSWSRASRQSAQNHGRRRSRSKSPNRLERIPEDYPTRDRDRGSKERGHSNRDHQVHDRERDKIEHEKKREREERERKHNEREKREQERKQHERELKRASREEKEREKEKEREREKEREKSREKKRDSSDDEKKDKKTKEKRKKKKDKDADRKKNKKEKKERKEREKERDKEKDKERDTIKKEVQRESKVEESFESIEPEPQPQPQLQLQDEHRDALPDEQLFNPPPPTDDAPSGKEETDSTMEEGEIQDTEEPETDAHSTKSKQQLQHENEILDLYGDICQDEEIKYDYQNSMADAGENNDQKAQPLNQENKKSSPPDFKRFDSVLDIHANLDFEPDLDEMEVTEQKKESNPYASIMPELSKWERDDDPSQSKDESNPLNALDASDEKAGKVTTEVLKRAENAIFARAINAIRPIEIKKISVERQKLYSNDPSKDASPVPSVISQVKSPNRELATVQITVPANNNSERSVEIKPEKQKSIKDRLGSKITEPSSRKHRSKSQSPVRKSTVEKVRPGRSRSREREAGYRRDDREVRRTSEVKRVHETAGNRGRERIQSDFNSRGRDQRKEVDRRRDFGQDRSGGSRGERTDRDRDRAWEQDRLRDKNRSRGDIARDRDRGEADWNRGGDKSRERPNTREDRRVGQPSEDPRGKDRTKSKDRERQKEPKRDDSRSRSSDRNNRDRATRGDREHKRKHADEHARTPPEKRSKRDRSKDTEKSDSKVGNEKTLQRKKSTIDEANFVPDYDEQIDNAGTNGKPTEPNIVSRHSKDKVKTPEARASSAPKRSHSPTESSSSSSSSSSESESDSDDNGKKKKRSKHKKNRKKSRRSSSVESGESSKHKRSKSKKKNKSSKKKKKSKK
ncbi:E3 ubiquitin-protein ligase RBBP6 isoform X2 [Hermetia illucens]|uniref:E3 ubiquitin-protein ligase RBBP6 isoform X2 n=1 Tax=Hermetia illucens TaxID=343691 RepID=UPI0018CBFD1A|nr:E3 ubiquitin-protein ligase RBBP6 isoform X2 [Hermetia illucens]